MSLAGQGLLTATSGHPFVTIRRHDWTVYEKSPYTLSSSVIAAIVVAYLLFILFVLVLYAP